MPVGSWSIFGDVTRSQNLPFRSERQILPTMPLGRTTVALSRFRHMTYCSSSQGKDLFSAHDCVRTLEISTMPQGPWSLAPGKEATGASWLRDGTFHATVHPDLPPIAKLSDLPSHLLSTASATWQSSPSPSATPSDSITALRVPGWQVRTVAAQTHTMPTLRAKMVTRGNQIQTEAEGGALLLVSGGKQHRRSVSQIRPSMRNDPVIGRSVSGHPLRSVPLAGPLLPASSLHMLKAAHQLRQQGLLPAGVQFWAVENPLTHTIDRLQQKIDTGAEAIISQPPLLPDRFQHWWHSVLGRGLHNAAKLIVGVPIISSAANLAFWLRLTDAKGPEADSVLSAYLSSETAAGRDPAALEKVRKTYTLRMLTLVKSLPGVAGIHIMPVTRKGWRDLGALVEDGQL